MSNAGIIDRTRAALVKRFRDTWGTASPPAALPLVAFEMPNKKFARPDGKPWGRLSIVFSGRENAAVGGLRVRIRGMLYVQVFTPEGDGTKVLTDAGDALAAVFDNVTIPHATGPGNVVCQAVDISATGSREGYEQMTYAVPFYSDDNRP